jgi:adenine phosphoribosyltransferase
MDELKKLIRDIPDFPKEGIVFKDITTLLKDPKGLRQAIDEMARPYQRENIDLVVAVESRGFIFGGVIAYLLNAGFIPVRKPGKLPADTVQVEYELEYAMDTVEMHQDAIQSGNRVLLVDDLLATGGTAAAAAHLIKNLGGIVVGVVFLIELSFLKGRRKLEGLDVQTIMDFPE